MYRIQQLISMIPAPPDNFLSNIVPKSVFCKSFRIEYVEKPLLLSGREFLDNSTKPMTTDLSKTFT